MKKWCLNVSPNQFEKIIKPVSVFSEQKFLAKHKIIQMQTTHQTLSFNFFP